MAMMKRSESGFTLIEILIALVILSVALAGMVPVLVHSVRGNTFGESTTQGGTFSQDKLEELRRVAFSDLAPGSDSPATGFTRTWTIDNGSGGSSCSLCSDDVLGVEVITTWADRQGRTRTATFFTMRGNL